MATGLSPLPGLIIQCSIGIKSGGMAMRLLIVGGDKRFGYLQRVAQDHGWQAEAIWLDGFDPAYGCAWPKQMDFDAYVLPYPFCEREGMILTPLASRPLPAQEAALQIPRGALVIAGSLGDLLQKVAVGCDWKLKNPGLTESFTVGNAVPSAEGAIHAAMAATEGCLHGSHCLIIGYGRLGRVLARMLHGLGARVCVAARKQKDRTWIAVEGYEPIVLEHMESCLPRMGFVFNTAPARVLGEAQLSVLPKESLVIDLASAPYGVDFEAAKAMGLRAWIEPSLPGRYAPRYAAKVLLETIEGFIKE